MHITITGDLGSGKSTICHLLKERLSYDIYSTGNVQRSLAQALNMTTLEFNDYTANNPDIDHEIDDQVVKIAKERKNDALIFDSRMAWHFVPKSLKLYLTVHPLEAAKRIYNQNDRGSVESYQSIEEAKVKLLKRREKEITRFQSIYGVVCNDPKHFDLIIDTTDLKEEEVYEKIISFIKKRT